MSHAEQLVRIALEQKRVKPPSLPDLRGLRVRHGDLCGRVVDYGTGRFPLVEFDDEVTRVSRNRLVVIELPVERTVLTEIRAAEHRGRLKWHQRLEPQSCEAGR